MVRPVSTPAHIEGSPAHSSHCAATALSTARFVRQRAAQARTHNRAARGAGAGASTPTRLDLFADQRSFALEAREGAPRGDGSSFMHIDGEIDEETIQCRAELTDR